MPTTKNESSSSRTPLGASQITEKKMKYDGRQLQPGDRVKVGVRTGTVRTVHEPKWRDHKTKQYRTEVSGADVLFDNDQIPTFIQIQAITLLLEPKNQQRGAMPDKAIT